MMARLWSLLAVAGALLALTAGGCVAPGAIEAEAFSPSPAQPVTATASVTAGRDSKIFNIPVSASGSGWPLVAVGLLCVGVLWLWTRGQRTEGRLRVITGAIQQSADTPQRTNMLEHVKSGLGDDHKPMKKWLGKQGLLAEPNDS